MEGPICCYYEDRKKEIRNSSVSFNKCLLGSYYMLSTKFSLVGTNMIKTLTCNCVPEGCKIRVKGVLKEEILNLFWQEINRESRVFCHAI